MKNNWFNFKMGRLSVSWLWSMINLGQHRSRPFRTLILRSWRRRITMWYWRAWRTINRNYILNNLRISPYSRPGGFSAWNHCTTNNNSLRYTVIIGHRLVWIIASTGKGTQSMEYISSRMENSRSWSMWPPRKLIWMNWCRVNSRNTLRRYPTNQMLKKKCCHFQ